MSKYSVGIPKESKIGESRVALIPSHVRKIKEHSLYTPIYVEKDAGTLAGFTDQDYINAGAIICETKAEVYEKANFIVKVKEPTFHDLKYITHNHIIFCYFHLAANPELTKTLLKKRITAIAFESMVEHFRHGKTTLPLLEPMSKIAGALSIHMAHDIMRNQLKQLITYETNVHIVGAGNVGLTAAKMATGLGATACLYDVSDSRLFDVGTLGIPHLVIMPNLKDNPDALLDHLHDPTSDISIVVCGALVRDDKAPKLITKETLDKMSGKQYRPTVFVDVSIDQGGCIEGIQPTSLDVPYYQYKQHYMVAVPNMPGSVSHTASRQLSACVWPYVGLLVGQVDTTTLHMREDLIDMFEILNSGTILKSGVITNDTLKTLYGAKGEFIV